MEERKKILKANIFWMILVILNLAGTQVLGMLVKNATTSVLLAQALIIVPVILFLIITKQNPVKLLRLHKFHFGSGILVVLLALCLFPIIMVINALSMMFATNTMAGTMNEITGNGLPYALLILSALPACVEEITFRGVMMGTYDEGKRPIRAIIFSSIAFAVMHMNFNQMCYAFFMGLVMGLVVELTGSLFASMLVHFTINGTSTAISWASAQMQKQMGENADELAGSLNAAAQMTPKEMWDVVLMLLPVAIIAAGICYLLIKAIASLNGRAEQLHFWTSKEYREDREDIPKTRIFDIPYGIAMGICVGISVLVELLLRGIIEIA